MRVYQNEAKSSLNSVTNLNLTYIHIYTMGHRMELTNKKLVFLLNLSEKVILHRRFHLQIKISVNRTSEFQ